MGTLPGGTRVSLARAGLGPLSGPGPRRECSWCLPGLCSRGNCSQGKLGVSLPRPVLTPPSLCPAELLPGAWDIVKDRNGDIAGGGHGAIALGGNGDTGDGDIAGIGTRLGSPPGELLAIPAPVLPLEWQVEGRALCPMLRGVLGVPVSCGWRWQQRGTGGIRSRSRHPLATPRHVLAGGRIRTRAPDRKSVV